MVGLDAEPHHGQRDRGGCRGVPPQWYSSGVASVNPRIQVTVDEEFARALARVDPAPPSRSALVRDLALRGARAVEQERARADEALAVLLEIADGERDYDLGAAAEQAARRGDRLP